MALSASEDNLVTFVSGVDAAGRIAATSHATWVNDSYPARYDGNAGALKWGTPLAGTGATISYAFDAASNWSAGEQSAFVAAMHLWQAEANIRFVPAAFAGRAGIVITRGDEGTASTSREGYAGSVGSTRLPALTHAEVTIDTGKSGFGPIGASFATGGGYPWSTVVHELGHAIGLSHAGPYDSSSVPAGFQSPTGDDRAESIMSYWDPQGVNWRTASGYRGVPVTPMPVDIAAAQRLYGAPVDSPLGGGTVFGFHTNIQGDIAPFFDFSVNTQPIVTLFSTGAANTLDLTGFGMTSTVYLRPELASSVGGLTQNLQIADGTRIDTLLLGAGNDHAEGNDNGDVIMGGAGADQLVGGAGNDHLYGALTVATPGDGADQISGGDGGDYLQGNGGADRLNGDGGSDRIHGGADDDVIVGGPGNDSVNGNLGNDLIDGGGGDDYLRGGQGDDQITGGPGSDIMLGDLGNDTLVAGDGADFLYGGPGADLFQIAGTDAGAFDTILDFEDGVDHLRQANLVPSANLVHLGAEASDQAAVAAAAGLIGGGGTVAVATVGSDALVLFAANGAIDAVRILGVSDALISTADFA